MIALKEEMEKIKKGQPSLTFYEQPEEDLLDISLNFNFSDIFGETIIFEDSLCRIKRTLNYSISSNGESMKTGFLDAEVEGCGILPKILLEGLKVIKYFKDDVPEDEWHFQLHDNRLLIFSDHQDQEDTTEEGNTDDDDHPCVGHPCVGARSVLEFVRQ